MAEEFEILAASVLSGEATEAQAARLEQLLSQDPARRTEFAELRASWTSLKELGSLARALDVPSEEPPPERLKKWQAELATKFGVAEEASSGAKPCVIALPVAKDKKAHPKITLALAAVVVTLALVGSLYFSGRFSRDLGAASPVAYVGASAKSVELKREGKAWPMVPAMILRATDEIKIPAGVSVTLISSNGVLVLQGPVRGFVSDISGAAQGGKQMQPAMRTALFGSAEQTRELYASTRSSVGIAIYSPVGFTADSTPVILWKEESGTAYNISITDELMRTNPPFRATGVTSPVEFAGAWPGRTLAADGLYRLRIEAGGNALGATEVTFRTLAQTPPTRHIEPDAELLEAYEMLVASPARVGDALAVLLRLPSDVADSEFATRLKLFAFGQLGYEEEFEAAATKLRGDRSAR